MHGRKDGSKESGKPTHLHGDVMCLSVSVCVSVSLCILERAVPWKIVGT